MQVQGYHPCPHRCASTGLDKTLGILLEIVQSYLLLPRKWANGLRYPRVGGTRERHFAGINSKPHKLPENAATPTRRVHAVLGTHFCLEQRSVFSSDPFPIFKRTTTSCPYRLRNTQNRPMR